VLAGHTVSLAGDRTRAAHRIPVAGRSLAPDRNWIRVAARSAAPDRNWIRVERRRPAPDRNRIRGERRSPAPDRNWIRVERRSPAPDRNWIRGERRSPAPDRNWIRGERRSPAPDRNRAVGRSSARGRHNRVARCTPVADSRPAHTQGTRVVGHPDSQAAACSPCAAAVVVGHGLHPVDASGTSQSWPGSRSRARFDA
jgi:hypothetical protein